MRAVGWLVTLCLAGATGWAGAAPPLVVKTVFQEGFPVKYDADNKEYPGICVEVIRALEEVDPDLHFTGLGTHATTARILRMLDTHEIDVFVGIGRTADREARYDWIAPPVFSAHPRLYVRREDATRFRTLDDIRRLKEDRTILVNFGSVQDEYLQDIPGLSIESGGADTEKNLQKLMLGRGRFYFGSDLNTGPVIRQMALGGRVLALPIRFEQADNYMVVARDAPPELKVRLRSALGKLVASGRLERIAHKYLD